VARRGKAHVRRCVIAGEIDRRVAEAVGGPARRGRRRDVAARVVGEEDLTPAREHVPGQPVGGVVEEAVPPA